MGHGNLLLLFALMLTCSTLANIKPKSHKNVTKSGQKRIDVQVNKWREAQNAINSLIDESIANEVTKAKKEVKALLEKNIVKHLHEASRRAMQGKVASNQEEDDDDNETEEAEGEELNNDNQSQGGVCQDEFENCRSLATSGVCETSKAAMKKHCARTCGLCDDPEEDLPPASPVNKQGNSADSWTIIGSDGERFTAGGIQQGTRKAAILSAQVQRLLEYVKKHAPHLTLKKIKPGVMKLVRIHEKDHHHKHRLSLKKHNRDQPKKVVHEDNQHDNYWTMKDDKDSENPNVVPKNKAKGGMLHFDFSNIFKENEDFETPNAISIQPKKKPKSEEYLKHICHPMCKKTCISSCAPGCCAGEHKQDFPLYHRKSSHCHPFCKKHCISSCPLTCCTDTQKTSKTWHHSQVHHLTPGCHPMCKKNCVPSCPKACCAHIPPKKRSHCHPLCKTNCLSSCPLSCCSHKDQIKEKCHPLCRKSCLPSCPDECCRRKGKEKKLIMKSTPNEDTEENRDGDTPERTGKTCPGLCPDSCAPACHSGCCDSKKEKTTHYKPVTHITPSGCTANCVYKCLPGCPPACCTRTIPTTQQQISDPQVSPVVFPFSQPIVTSFAAAPPPPQPVLPVYQQEINQPLFSAESQISSKSDADVQPQLENKSLYAPKHCPSSCLTHCSPECVRSDCCDLD